MKKVGDEVGYNGDSFLIERVSPDAYLIKDILVGRYWISVDLAYSIKRIDRKETIKKIFNDKGL